MSPTNPCRLAENLNRLSVEDAFDAMLGCCGSRTWAARMVERRPYVADDQVWAEAAEVFRGLSDADWREALDRHPKIGDGESLRAKFVGNRTWSREEQAGVADASEAVLHQLVVQNETYYQKFGYTFVVCATGKSADEMLAILSARLTNDPQDELRVAADEQRKITQLRLKKWEPA